jgi:hypothetical protein
MVTQFDEKGKIFTNIISKRPVRVIIQTTSHCIRGEIYVRPDERLKDELNHSEDFIAVTNAVVLGADQQELYRTGFLTINTRQVIWLIPDDEINNNETA